MKRGKINLPWQVILCALFVFFITNILSFYIFDHTPHINDEVAYVFQAKLFKSGRLYAPSPSAKEFFNFPHVINNGKWYSHYPPGYPFFLLMGLLIGAPWIVSPFFAFLSIFLFYFLGKELFSKKVGILASFLGAVSIWFLLMSSTMMSHTTCLFLITLFLLFFFRSLKRPTALNGLIAGIGLGGAILIRPYNSILIALPFLVFFAFKIIKRFRLQWKNAMIFGLVVALFLSILFVYNYLTNGHPLIMGYTVRYGTDHSVGFGKAGYTESEHTPYKGMRLMVVNLDAMNKDIFGWPLSSFLALIPLFFVTRGKRKILQNGGLFLSSFLVLLFGLFIYWGTFILIGARYFFEIIPIFFLLSAVGISELPTLLSQRFKNSDPLLMKKMVTVVLCVFIVYAFAVRFPRWIWPKETNWYYDGFANNFAGVNPSIPEVIDSAVEKPSLVLLDFIYHTFDDFPNYWWGSGFIKNDPDLKGDVIYAMSQGKKNTEIFQHYPNRKIYLYLGTLEKGMLVPLKKNESTILCGNPIKKEVITKNPFELISDPLEFYTVYSQEFGDFLKKIYQENELSEINVEYLLAMGDQAMEDKKFKFASHCLEAALQIEKSPIKRILFYNQLVGFYAKSGQRQDSIRILNNIRQFDNRKLHRMFPEKGF